MPHARWTEAEIADIRARLKTRAVKQVAHDIGVSEEALRMVMMRAGIRAKPLAANGLPPRAAMLLGLANEGLSRAEMAQRMGISERSVTAWLSRIRKRMREAQP